MKEHLPSLVALIAGVIFHIIKKAAQKRLDNANFSLKDYLVGHPYQTLSLFGAAAGAYLGLFQLDGGVSLGAAFMAGIAANSVSDIAPGQR